MQKQKELDNFIELVKKKKNPKSYLIAVFHKAQGLYGYLSKDIIRKVSKSLNMPLPHLWGVATFYHYFNLNPVGKHQIFMCMGTACYVRGGDKVLEAIKDELKISIGQTTSDDFFTLHESRCLGTCGLAPVMMIDDKVYGQLTPKKAVDILRGFKI